MNAGVFWGVQQPEADTDGSGAAGGNFVHPARTSNIAEGSGLDDVALHNKLDELSNQLNAMVNQPACPPVAQLEQTPPAPMVAEAQPAAAASPAPAPAPAAPAPTSAASVPSTEQDPSASSLIERIEQNEKASSDSLNAVNHKLSELGSRLQSIQEQAATPPAPATNERPEFETAIKTVMDQVEQAEKRNRDLMKAMQDRMAEMGARAAAAPEAPVSQSAPAIQDLERRLAELNEKLEQRENQTGDGNRLSTIESKLAELTQGIEALPSPEARSVGSIEAATYLADRIEAGEQPIVAATRDDLAQVESRIEELSRQVSNAAAPSAASAADNDRMRNDVAALTEQVRQIKASAASNRDVQSMRSSLENLTKVVSQKDANQPLDALHQRINELAHTLQNSVPSQAERGKLTELEAKILQLDTRLAAAQAQPDNTMAVKALESQVKQVSDRLGEQEKRFAALSQIENSIAQLAGQLESTRNEVSHSTQQTAQLEASITQLTSRMQTTRNEVASSAEVAAQRMAEQLRMEVDVKTAQQAAAQPASSDVAALHQGLQAVQTQTQTSDKRTQDTLVAVHDTLDSVIERMNQIEAAKAAVAASGVQPVEAATAVAPAAPSLAPEVPSLPPVASSLAPAATDLPGSPQVPGYAQAATPMDQNAAFAAPQFEPAAPTASEVVPAVAGLAPVQPAEAAPQSGGRHDFIAAAREAARAAGHSQNDPSGSGSPAQSGGMVLGAASAPGKVAGTDDEGSGKKNKLILAGIFALLVGAATGYGVLNFNNGPAEPVMDAPKALSPAPSTTPNPAAAPSQNQPAGIQPAETAPLDGGALGTENSAPQSDPVGDGVQPAESVPFDPTAPAKSSNLQGIDPADPIQTGSISNTSGKGANLSANTPVPTNKQLDPNITSIGKVEPPANGTGLTALTELSDQAKSAPASSADPFVTGSIPNAATATIDDVQGTNDGRTDAEWIASAGLPQALGPKGMLAAAAKGDKVAQFMVGARYSDGKAVPKDFDKASKWYHKSATKGLAPAQYRLGTLYERGRGLKKNLKTAKSWYEHAAHRGHIKAMHNIAVLLANGMEGQPEFSQAAYWFKKAAALGLKDSQYNLAILYQQGMGVKKDLNEAYRWYSLAAKQKDKDAAKRMKLLGGKLDAADLEKAKRMVETWRPIRANFAANVVTPPIGGWEAAASEPKKAMKAPIALAPLPGDAVKQAQKMLNAIGFEAGTADGVMGPQTAKAIRTFQKQEGLEVTGKVSPNLLHRLHNLPG